MDFFPSCESCFISNDGGFRSFGSFSTEDDRLLVQPEAEAEDNDEAAAVTSLREKKKKKK